VLPTPALVDGVELLGEYQGSGLKEPPSLVRRPDGRVLQLTPLLYAIAARADGRRDAAAIAEEIGRGLTARDVVKLVEAQLVQAGIVTAGAPTATTAASADAPAPFALRVRAAFVPAGVVRILASILRPLFSGVVVGAVLAWLMALDFWLAVRHGLDAAVSDVVATPGLLLVILALALAGTLFHELGHATACRYGGARPGRLGAGFYYVWPVFYTDVTDTYRLDRRGRIRTDLGGVYFNAVFALLVAAAYFRTGFEPLLLVILIQHVQAAQQLIPWLRLDGYYVLTDLVGVPDVLSRLRPILASLVPGRDPDPRVTALKPWVRAVVSAYVLVTVPAIAVTYALLLAHAPRFFETAVRGLRLQTSLLELAWRAQDSVSLALAAVNAFALVVPLVGIAFVVASTASRLGRWLLARVTPPPLVRTSATFGAGVAVAALFFAGFTGARIFTSTADRAPTVAKKTKPRARPTEPRTRTAHRYRPRPSAPGHLHVRSAPVPDAPSREPAARSSRPVRTAEPPTGEQPPPPATETVTQTETETVTHTETMAPPPTDTTTGSSTTVPTTTEEVLP
jgi:putative peptide zinc metalloprotease protein